MTTLTKVTTLLATVLVALGLSTNAMAGSNEKEQLAAINAAKISLSDAILLAEQEVGGRAVEAEVDDHRDEVFYYEIEVITPDGVEKEVRIDMNTGKIVKVEEDRD